MVNITLSADENLIARARTYAQARNTTLNQLIRDYLGRLTGKVDPEQAAEEFAELARGHSGRSEEGFVFDRRDAHARGSSDQKKKSQERLESLLLAGLESGEARNFTADDWAELKRRVWHRDQPGDPK